MFGESVLDFLKTDRKASARWQRGIWLGKSLVNVHIIAQGAGIFVTRSIRRSPWPCELEDLGEVVSGPWEYCYASLGHRMVYNKRLSGPLALGVGAALSPRIDVEAIQVQAYAAEHPDEDQDVPPEGEAGQVILPAGASSSDLVVVSLAEPCSGQKRGDTVAFADEAALKKPRVDVGEEQPMTPKSDGGAQPAERAPKTPRLDSQARPSMSLVTSIDLSHFAHEDEPVKFHFDEKDLDQLEQCELEFNDADQLELDDWGTSLDDDWKDALQQLSFPYGPDEPQVSEAELQRLDAPTNWSYNALQSSTCYRIPPTLILPQKF